MGADLAHYPHAELPRLPLPAGDYLPRGVVVSQVQPQFPGRRGPARRARDHRHLRDHSAGERWAVFFRLPELTAFLHHGLVAALLHDWGKANDGFQGMLQGQGRQLISTSWRRSRLAVRRDAPVVSAHSSRVIRPASSTWRRMRCCRALSGAPASASARAYRMPLPSPIRRSTPAATISLRTRCNVGPARDAPRAIQDFDPEYSGPVRTNRNVRLVRTPRSTARIARCQPPSAVAWRTVDLICRATPEVVGPGSQGAIPTTRLVIV